MSNPHETDRWRELADLLGLPPDDKKETPPQPAPAQAPPPPPREPENRFEDREQEVAIPRGVPEPVEQAAREGRQFVEAEFSHAPVGELPPLEAEAHEPAGPGPGGDDEPRQERSRRGRRRGRRGNKEDGRERGRQPDQEETGQPRDDAVRETENEPNREPVREFGNVDDSPEPSFSRAGERDVEEEERLEGDDEQVVEQAPDDADDEEIDKLTDWNVPSWTELIGSLYRPER